MLGRVFRGKFAAALKRAFAEGLSIGLWAQPLSQVILRSVSRFWVIEHPADGGIAEHSLALKKGPIFCLTKFNPTHMYSCPYNWLSSMGSYQLDRHTVVPLYYQIRQGLLDQIKSGDLKPGDPLPSEQEISEKLRVSRMTARQAVKSLCSLGVAYSLRGKGTFVLARKLEKNWRQVQSFTEEMETLGHKPSSRVLLFQVVPATPDVAEALQLNPNENVIRLDRVRLADDSPMGVERSHLPFRLCPTLLEVFDPKTSLYQALWENFAIRLTVTDEVVEVGVAGPEDRHLLGVRRGSPVFLFQRISYMENNLPLEFVRSTYRGDRYRIVNRLTCMNSEARRSLAVSMAIGR